MNKPTPAFLAYLPLREVALKKAIKSDFIKNVLVLMSGSLVAQIISVGTAPVITRLFTPENFGVLALFVAVVTILSGVGSLCYERSILLPKKNDEAINIFSLSSLILLSATITTFFVILISNDRVASLLGNAKFSIWLWLVPLGLLIEGFLLNLRFWLIRNKEFKTLSFATISNTFVSSLVKITIGIIVGAYAGGLIVGFISGLIVSSFILIKKSSILYTINKYRSDISFGKIKNMAVLYRKFPMFASWNTLLNSFSKELVVFMFSLFFNPAVVGFYSLGRNFLGRPINIVAHSIQDVYFQKSAREYSNKMSIKKSLKKTTFGLIAVGFLPFLFLAFFGKSVFIIIFGSSWATAGLYVQIMAPWFFLLFISSPANIVYEVCQKQGIRLVLNITLTFMRFSALLIGTKISKNPEIALGFFVMVNVLYHITIIIFAFFIASSADKLNGPFLKKAKNTI